MTRNSQPRTVHLVATLCLLFTLALGSLPTLVSADDNHTNPPIVEPTQSTDPNPLGLGGIDPLTIVAITEAISVI